MRKIQEAVAEREGFEPPIALRLCLISSQVHSTGLCHLSALFTTIYAPVEKHSQCRLRFRPLARRVRAERIHNTSGDLIGTTHELSISHRQLGRRMGGVPGDGDQMHAFHHPHAAGPMAVVVLGVIRDAGLGQHRYRRSSLRLSGHSYFRRTP